MPNAIRMSRHRHACRFHCSALIRQAGASLVVSLMMMTVIMMLGLSATRLALQGEKGARNLRDRQIALESAQSALLDARRDIFSGKRADYFSDISTIGFSGNCGQGTTTEIGLCDGSSSPLSPWQVVDFSEEDAAKTQYAFYGQFTGAEMRVGEGSLPAKKPRYIIDVLDDLKSKEEAGGEARVIYRITAVGFGVRPTSQVMLQTVVRKKS